ncbi:phage putative head morphogenesis protein, SPP1 gp7 family [Streptococcus gallolyticus]|uniref:Phage putative head morphogenesis protein, SPP1 gp7 family n=1 Tax=Streptococcus gallolyticus TaxID=315405 RepID=A0A1H7XTI3_9STRE|nr:minor capsid protein [Streptococcus gallolyticus]SEF25500.1 phage putative head morphogenesis protein, SPP1 gp7 family [Streptococcus gallolyticus]SEM36468.1 phage putative head morphogenesis protein, SPP1 gp7 family [Streptococcus gallolyticus]
MSKKLSYWERRKAQLIFNQMDKAEKQADSFDNIYDGAKRYLTRQSNKVFDKFQRDYGLTEKEARLVLKTIKDDKTIDNLKRQLQAQPDNPNINQLLADLDSPAFAFRINRFNDLQKQIDNISNKVYQSEKQQSDTYYSDFMNDSYYHHTYELQKRLGVAYDFNTLPEREISRLQRSNWYGDNYSSRIWNNTQALADSLKNELLIGLMTGRSTRDIAEIISQRFDVGKNASRRLVRTESAYYHGQMELKSYDEADISQYQFVATLDLRTSTICREHDLMVYKTKEAIVGVNYPPMHPWCRSTTIAYFDDKWAKGKKRRAKDPKTGKNILVPADMTYDDWYAKHVKPLYKVDGLKQSDIDRANQQYIKYKDILGDERTPKTLADFVDLKYNNAEGYKQLRLKSRLQEHINNGDLSLTINQDKQNRHTQNHKAYNNYVQRNKSKGKPIPGYLTVDNTTVQKIINDNYLNGTIIRRQSGQYSAIIKTDAKSGVAYSIHDLTGANPIATDEFTIHISKSTTHLVPKIPSDNKTKGGAS